MDLFLWMGFDRSIELSEVEDVVNKFNILDNGLKKVFSKVDPLLVVSLIFDRNANEKHIYTVEAILKPGENKWTTLIQNACK